MTMSSSQVAIAANNCGAPEEFKMRKSNDALFPCLVRMGRGFVSGASCAYPPMRFGSTASVHADGRLLTLRLICRGARRVPSGAGPIRLATNCPLGSCIAGRASAIGGSQCSAEPSERSCESSCLAFCGEVPFPSNVCMKRITRSVDSRLVPVCLGTGARTGAGGSAMLLLSACT